MRLKDKKNGELFHWHWIPGLDSALEEKYMKKCQGQHTLFALGGGELWWELAALLQSPIFCLHWEPSTIPWLYLIFVWNSPLASLPADLSNVTSSRPPNTWSRCRTLSWSNPLALFPGLFALATCFVGPGSPAKVLVTQGTEFKTSGSQNHGSLPPCPKVGAEEILENEHWWH